LAATFLCGIAADPEVTERADSGNKAKTTMPRIAAGGYKLPSSSLLQRPDEQQQVDADELKLLAQVLTEKYAEFEIHGQITQINPGPVVTTFEFKPEAGIKYSRITNLSTILCLALKAESILIERMAGKSTVGVQCRTGSAKSSGCARTSSRRSSWARSRS
jgi:DNA segregation ATPase FtsK/SpoIIIE, S-DNA-T family